MKNLTVLLLSLVIHLHTSCKESEKSSQIARYHTPSQELLTTKSAPDTKNIQVALLLDTSNSMDGLIDQAKAQLWRIVNELSYAKCGNATIKLQIALYEYGNDGLSAQEGFVRQIVPFSDDLDEISEHLFALRTNGGNEFCGKVIATSIDQLRWQTTNDHLKLIFIAGNEPFDQGPIDYKDATTNATEKDVTINTIFCGAYDQGIASYWKDGAVRTGGEYSAIDHTIATKHVATPYDDEILRWNKKLNATYVRYGTLGSQKKQLQAQQDAEAEVYSKENAVSRTVSKSSKFYKNKSWDLVDAVEEAEDVEMILKDIAPAALPKELQDKSPEQLKKHVATKKKERTGIQQEIQKLQIKRSDYIAQNGEEGEENLEKALLKAIKIQGKRKNFEWKK